MQNNITQATTMQLLQQMFMNMFLTDEDKVQQEIDNKLEEDKIDIKKDYLLSTIAEHGFNLDKGNANDLVQFTNAINSLMQLKLTGEHTVTLYNQRLELHFDNKSNLTNIKLI